MSIDDKDKGLSVKIGVNIRISKLDHLKAPVL